MSREPELIQFLRRHAEEEITFKTELCYGEYEGITIRAGDQVYAPDLCEDEAIEQALDWIANEMRLGNV